MISKTFSKRLNKLFEESPIVDIGKDDKIIIFSDVHMGNGGFNDDFAKNSDLFINVLRSNYLPKGYKLILNGDIEDLYKFSIKSIQRKWDDLYNLFDEFRLKNDLFKIFGNHDHQIFLHHNNTRKYNLLEALRLRYDNNDIFIYHGHQTAHILEQYSKIVEYFIKTLFRAVSNKPVPFENGKKYQTEEIAYKFASQKKIVSILGHTHRPLFESISKVESLKMIIENLLAKYNKAHKKDKLLIAEQINKYKDELFHIYDKGKDLNYPSSIYNDKMLVPCLFNSGAITGKRGMTGIEIRNGMIALVYWFDSKKSQRYFDYKDVKTKRLGNTDYYRAILRKDKIENIFNRINLLNK